MTLEIETTSSIDIPRKRSLTSVHHNWVQTAHLHHCTLQTVLLQGQRSRNLPENPKLHFDTVQRTIMSIEAMGKQRPQTPPAIDAGEAQDGFLHGLAQHNAMIEHQPAPYTLDNGSYVHSGTSTTYGTPEPGQWYMDQYGNRSFAYHDPPNFGMDMPYVSPIRASLVT